MSAVLEELRVGYGAARYVAVLKRANYRSLGLLRSLGFWPASPEQAAQLAAEADEVVMGREPAACEASARSARESKRRFASRFASTGR